MQSVWAYSARLRDKLTDRARPCSRRVFAATRFSFFSQSLVRSDGAFDRGRHVNAITRMGGGDEVSTITAHAIQICIALALWCGYTTLFECAQRLVKHAFYPPRMVMDQAI